MAFILRHIWTTIAFLFFPCYDLNIDIFSFEEKKILHIISNSSVVERSTVNRLVVGSSPTWRVFTQGNRKVFTPIHTHRDINTTRRNKE